MVLLDAELFYFFRLFRNSNLNRFTAFALTFAFSYSQVMLMVMTDAYFEMIIVLNSSAMLLVCSMKGNMYSAPDYKKTLLFALLAAGTASIKLTGLIAAVLPLSLILFPAEGCLISKSKVKQCLLLISVCAVLALPFYLRPWIMTGNPFYPYFARFFSDSRSSLAMSGFHHAIGSDRYGSFSIPMFFSAPAALTFATKTFEGSFGYQSGIIFVLYIVSLFIFLKRRKYFWITVPIILYIFWFCTAQQARFLLPALLLIFFITGITLSRFRNIYRKGTALILIVLTCVSLPFSSSGYYYYSWLEVLGKIKTADYLYTGTGDYYLKAVQAISDLTPADAEILLLYEHRLLYIPRKCRIGTPFLQ
jgi:hypothetical protein